MLEFAIQSERESVYIQNYDAIYTGRCAACTAHTHILVMEKYMKNKNSFTYRCQKLWRGRLIGDAGRKLDARAQVKVTDLDGAQFIRRHAQNVLRLQVAMGNASLVQKIQSGRNFLDNLGGFMFRKAHMLLDASQQWTTVYLCGQKKKVHYRLGARFLG